MTEGVQRIDLNDYVQPGEGGTALTYNHKDGKTLAKLFMPGFAADTTRLPDMRELAGTWIDRLTEFPDDLKARFHRFLDTVPSTPTCLHGDLHIGNIITDGSRDLWIDVGDFAYGVPQWDLGMMYYSSHFMSEERNDNIFHLDHETLVAHWDAFARVYYGTDSQEALDAEIEKLHPFIATKIAFFISKLTEGKHPFSGPLLQLFDKYLPE